MKLHWGHKIAIVYTSFALFLGFMLYKSMQVDHELVTENYYEKEMAVQGKIEAHQNLMNADFNVDIRAKDGKVLVSLDGPDSIYSPQGKVNLYKPDNGSLDEEMMLVLDNNNSMSITPKGFRGRYNVIVSFEMNGVPYFAEKQILL
jgi:hypothetical protein